MRALQKLEAFVKRSGQFLIKKCCRESKVKESYLFIGFTSSTRLSNVWRKGVVVEAVEEDLQKVSVGSNGNW